MINVGTVHGIYVSIKGKDRELRNQISLDSKGIREDKFYAKDLNRSILIASLDSYILAQANGIDLEYGFLGENILLDFNPYSLKSGDRISIGEVVLEITQNCTICNSLSKVDPTLPELLKNDRGIFAKTFHNGTIYKGDKVNILSYK